MAAAMARGWAAGAGGPNAMLFCDIDRERAARLAEEVRGEAREKPTELALECDVVVLAVKPGALDEVAQDLEAKPRALISVLAATAVARLEEAFPGVPLLRVMPNQPAQVRHGVLCYAKSPSMSPDLEARLTALLGRLGAVVALDEPLLDGAMAVMSCTPAYFAVIARALADAGTAEGLDADLALSLVAATFVGTGRLLGVRSPEEIAEAVAPPGGATEAGLRALEDARVNEAMEAAVRASLERFR
jgi:pyrroline-5-carboxylate reductase